MIGLIFWYEANFSDSCSWSLKDTVCLWAIFMSFYIYRASELFDALPLPLLKFLGRGLWSGTNEWIKVRSPAPPHYWVTNAVLGRVTTAHSSQHLFTAGLWQFIFFLLSFFFFLLQLLWTWTILWLIWRLFKLYMRMWVIEGHLSVSI